MKHFGATIFSGLLFFAVAFFSGLLPVSFAGVSPETVSVKHSRETGIVKLGISADGLLSLERTPYAPKIPPWAKSANHERTLRAFIASSRVGVSALYVEAVKPHEYYALTGSFGLLPEYTVIEWPKETALVFYGTAPNGKFTRYMVDLDVPALTSASVGVVPPPPLFKPEISSDIP